MGNNKTEEKDYTVIITIGAIIICLFLCIGGMFLSHWYATTHFDINTTDGNPQALFGDSFGAVNALISAFAFAGVIVAIFIQRNELRLQRKDLILQRKEFETQNDTLKFQRFENTFFNMMSLQQQIVDSLSFKDRDKVNVVEDSPNPSMGRISKEVVLDNAIQGRELFYHSFVQMTHHVKQSDGMDAEVPGMRYYLYNSGFNSYEDCYTPSYFDHYFRHLYTIIKFVDKTDFLSETEKYQYIAMVRATLSRYELVWIYYNGISSIGKAKFKKLIEKYSLLKNLREDLLSLSHENLTSLERRGLKYDWLLENGFSGTDYEFFLSEEENDEKYRLSAFYNSEDMEVGRELLERWKRLYES